MSLIYLMLILILFDVENGLVDGTDEVAKCVLVAAYDFHKTHVLASAFTLDGSNFCAWCVLWQSIVTAKVAEAVVKERAKGFMQVVNVELLLAVGIVLYAVVIGE